jgi:Ca2+-transporting ATPase
MPRRLTVRLVVTGLVIAVGTLGVLSWASGAFGDVVARTMGMTTFALFRLLSSLEEADEDESLFGGAILSNRPLLVGTAISVISIILATELGFLQRLLGTQSLEANQWMVCIVVALSLIVVEEIRKALRLRTSDDREATSAAAAAAA